MVIQFGSVGKSWNRLKKNRISVIGIIIVFTFVIIGFLGPLIAPHDPYKQDLSRALERPSLKCLFGKDQLGRDMLSRIIFGARISLIISLSTVAWAAGLGVMIGLIASYFGGRIDEITMRGTDVLMAFPPLLLAIAIISILGTGIVNLIFAVGTYTMPTFIRITRACVLSVKQNDYIEASRAVGYGHLNIMFSQILPNILGPIIVQATLTIGRVGLEAAGLSFLGLGVKPPAPEWGVMLSTGRVYLRVAPHVSIIPGMAIMLMVLGYNFLGDGLRDILDPRKSIR